MSFAFCLFTFCLSAQPKDNSPYSRLGLGEPVNQFLSAEAFGGMTAAYADPLYINLRNPAAIGGLTAATFEAGIFGEYSKLKFNNQSTTTWTGNLSHLALAFPLHNPLNDLVEKKKRNFNWSMSFALTPNTTVGYDIQTEEIHPDVDTTLNIFQGTGGTNKLTWGNGFKYKNFSGGVTIGYLFGQLESERLVLFRNLEASYNDHFIDNMTIRAFIWNIGAQYRYDFDKKKAEEATYTGKSLIFGVFGNSRTGFTTKSTTLRIRENFSYTPIQSDTLQSLIDVEGKGKLPAEFTIGVMYQKLGKFRLGGEYSIANWSNYENDAKDETLFNSRRVAVGGEFIPNAVSYDNYFERVRYRVGFYHRSDPRLEDLKQYAVTFGFGFPVILPRQQTSFVNLAFEIGRYKTDNAINENFMKIALGFTLNDSSWFFKRKFG